MGGPAGGHCQLGVCNHLVRVKVFKHSARYTSQLSGPHFTEEDTEAPKGSTTCSGSRGQYMENMGLPPCLWPHNPFSRASSTCHHRMSLSVPSQTRGQDAHLGAFQQIQTSSHF